VTLLGIVTEVKPPQCLNASYPMLVTLLGIVTEVKPLQPRKASFPMLVTSVLNLITPLPSLYVLVSISGK